MFFLLLCGTYLFRVGLIGVLSKYFKGVMAVTLTYLILTGITGGLRLAFIGGGMPFQRLWDFGGFTTMSIIHKLFATFYYIVNIRTALQIGDPKFYTKVCHFSLFPIFGFLYFVVSVLGNHSQNSNSHLSFANPVAFPYPQEPWVQMYREGNK